MHNDKHLSVHKINSKDLDGGLMNQGIMHSKRDFESNKNNDELY